jgi:lipopolysaccharide export system protein LptC
MLALVLSLAWWIDELTRPEVKKPQIARDTPDSYAHDLVVKRYNESGFLLQMLRTPRMTHFEKSGTTELSRPVVWQFSPDNPPWRMQAEFGVLKRREETIFLPGRVVIERNGKGDIAPYHIVTQDLTLDVKKSFASTSEAVQVNSNQQRLSALGMQAWLNEPPRLKLLHQVRGHYEFE